MAADKKAYVLSVNAGSSSLKISLYTVQQSEPSLVLVSNINNVSSPPAFFSFDYKDSSVEDQEEDNIKDHASGFEHFLKYLHSKAGISREEITHICHRVVHGGDYLDPVLLNKETFNHIEELSDLAPLHNGAALTVIQSCIEDMPHSKSIAFFDTSFHRTIAPHISNYAIDQEIARKRGLKKYGFHGISYAHILRAVSKFLQKPASSLNLILLHLGSGASVCAISQGKSFDTSMGLTPVSGLPGATRSGSVDPSLIFHYTNKAGKMTHDKKQAVDLHVTEAEKLLNKSSGWNAIAGTTDFGEVTKKALSGEDEKSKLAFDLFLDRILDYVGSYHLKLHGKLDAIVFSGGIGEKSQQLREKVGEYIECLGYAKVDAEKNESVNSKKDESVVDIGGEGEKKVLVCRTDEQYEMARQCSAEENWWKG